MSQIVRRQAKIAAVTYRSVELANAFDTVEAADMSHAVLMDHPGTGWIIPSVFDVLLEVSLQVIIDKLNDIDLAGMPSGGIANIEVLGIPGPGKLYQNMFGRIVLVIAPVAPALTKPVAPIHLSVVALDLD
jgi:hypothetical protein